ncbi:MAG: ABC transporter ATP-binding protein [Spirochaetales bacterium]|nr:ABC transporter ATP-binding protein [Spirochaetales bacterium]
MKTMEKTIDMTALSMKKGISGLWAMIAGYRALFFGAVISLGIAAGARIAGFYFIRFIIDEVLGKGSYIDRIWIFGLAFVGLAAIEGAGLFIKGVSAASYTEAVIRRLRGFLFDHIQRLSFAFHDHADSGKLLEQVTDDVESVNLFYKEQAVEIGRIVTLFVFSFAALISIDLFLGLLSVICIPLVVIQSMWFFRQIDRRYEAYQEQEAALTSVLRENVMGMRVVRGCSQQKHEIKKFEKENAGKVERGKRLIVYHAAYWPISDIICVIQTLVVYTAGAILTMEGKLSIGTYMAVCGLVVWIIWPMRNLGRVVIQATSGVVSFRRIMQVLKEKREEYDNKTVNHGPAFRGEVEFRGVSFRYRDGEDVLKEITFHCRPGEVVALVGETGSGKTTIVNLLPRFYPNYTGRIFIDGHELKTIPLTVLRRSIGIVEQEPFLFSATIRENISYGAGKRICDDDVVRAAQAASIHDLIESLPDKYESLVGERGLTLSGGQKQRIAIARTIIKNPKILLLDDATSEVDTITARRIDTALAKLAAGRTCFVIAHRIQTLMRADRILVLSKGRIVQSGTHDELVAAEGLYKRFYRMQNPGSNQRGKEAIHES